MCYILCLCIYIDPNAIPDETFTPYVDCALRHITQSLLRGSELPSDDMNFQYKTLLESLSRSIIPDTVTNPSVFWPEEQVSTCLVYVRDRVSVPRDMSVHAARLFRSHINLFLEAINSKK